MCHRFYFPFYCLQSFGGLESTTTTGKYNWGRSVLLDEYKNYLGIFSFVGGWIPFSWASIKYSKNETKKNGENILVIVWRREKYLTCFWQIESSLSKSRLGLREKHKSFEIQWLRVPSSIVIDIQPEDHFEKENISGYAVRQHHVFLFEWTTFLRLKLVTLHV